VALNDPAKYQSVSSTRRTIVKTGARLAYAAPVVAATMKVSGRSVGAQAVSGGGHIVTILGVSENPTDTGVDVVDGQSVCVSASGEVHLCLGDAIRQECPVGPAGKPPAELCCCGAFNCGLLLGKIGGGGLFPIGASGCFNAVGSGRLYLVVSDAPGGFADNDGSYQATVTV
jgi:hypothetical protein